MPVIIKRTEFNQLKASFWGLWYLNNRWTNETALLIGEIHLYQQFVWTRLITCFVILIMNFLKIVLWKYQRGYKVTRAYINTHKSALVIESSFRGSTPNAHTLATRIALTIWRNFGVIYENRKGRKGCWVTNIRLLTGTTFAISNQTVIKTDLFGINMLKSTHSILESKMASLTTYALLALVFAGASSSTLQNHDSSKYSSHASINNVASMSIIKHYSYIFVITVNSLFRDSLVC
jgi:hypothetical protein